MKFCEYITNQFFDQNLVKKDEKPENLDYSHYYIYFLVPFHYEKVKNMKIK